MRSKQFRTAAILAGLLWDTGWKFRAVRRAIALRQFRWIPALLLVNSVGLLPMLYLWKLSDRGARNGH